MKSLITVLALFTSISISAAPDHDSVGASANDHHISAESGSNSNSPQNKNTGNYNISK